MEQVTPCKKRRELDLATELKVDCGIGAEEQQAHGQGQQNKLPERK